MNSSIKTAVIAAIVALGIGASSATAASMIGSSQVKDNSLTTKDIKNGTLSVADLSAAARASLKGSRGPAGATGATGLGGSPGVQGPAGGFDPAKVSYVTGPKVNVPASSAGNPGAGLSVAKCPTGTKVVGGGYYFSYANAGITVETSGPLDDGTGWLAGFGNAGSAVGGATAYAVCAAK
jgi:hypothetical protein